jgi:hypothetical protein
MDTYYISKGKRQFKLHKKERRWGIEKREREREKERDCIRYDDMIRL